jgi:hypothetical protein
MIALPLNPISSSVVRVFDRPTARVAIAEARVRPSSNPRISEPLCSVPISEVHFPSLWLRDLPVGSFVVRVNSLPLNVFLIDSTARAVGVVQTLFLLRAYLRSGHEWEYHIVLLICTSIAALRPLAPLGWLLRDPDFVVASESLYFLWPASMVTFLFRTMRNVFDECFGANVGRQGGLIAVVVTVLFLIDVHFECYHYFILVVSGLLFIFLAGMYVVMQKINENRIVVSSTTWDLIICFLLLSAASVGNAVGQVSLDQFGARLIGDLTERAVVVFVVYTIVRLNAAGNDGTYGKTGGNGIVSIEDATGDTGIDLLCPSDGISPGSGDAGTPTDPLEGQWGDDFAFAVFK